MVLPHFVIMHILELKRALCSGVWLMILLAHITPQLALPLLPSSPACLLSACPDIRTFSSSNPGHTLSLSFHQIILSMVESGFLNFLPLASKFSRIRLLPLPSQLGKESLFPSLPIGLRPHCHPDFSNSPFYPLLPHVGDTSLSRLCSQGVELHGPGRKSPGSMDKSLKPSFSFPTCQMENVRIS